MKIQSTLFFFLTSFFAIGALFYVAILLSPSSKDALGMVFAIFGWPIIACWGLLYVKLPLLALVTSSAIMGSLWLQARFISKSKLEDGGIEMPAKRSKQQQNRLKSVLWIEAFILVSIVFVPIEHTYPPLSLLIWSATILPISIFSLAGARKHLKA
jgi:hypothetical protein